MEFVENKIPFQNAEPYEEIQEPILDEEIKVPVTKVPFYKLEHDLKNNDGYWKNFGSYDSKHDYMSTQFKLIKNTSDKLIISVDGNDEYNNKIYLLVDFSLWINDNEFQLVMRSAHYTDPCVLYYKYVTSVNHNDIVKIKIKKIDGKQYKFECSDSELVNNIIFDFNEYLQLLLDIINDPDYSEFYKQTGGHYKKYIKYKQKNYKLKCMLMQYQQ